jgi:pimeloyl-ACP methyl ester carboxylesterase
LKHVELGLAGTPLPPDYSMDYEAVALGNTLDYLKITQADFAAWSNGGQVALNYAIYHPERVRSLTLIEPNAYWVLRSRGPYPQALLDEIGFIRTLATDDVSEEQFCGLCGSRPQMLIRTRCRPGKAGTSIASR